jgi:hypothetical protein
VEKWASKRGAKDRTQDVWHEQWGERRGGPTEGEPDGKFESCWAEQEGTNGFGERWHNGCACIPMPLLLRGARQRASRGTAGEPTPLAGVKAVWRGR